MVLAFSTVILYFKPPVYIHEIRNGFECQKRVSIPWDWFPRWGEPPCRILEAEWTSGPGWCCLSWWIRLAVTASLSRFNCGPAAEGGTKAVLMPLLKAGPWARVRGLACQLLSSQTQHSASLPPPSGTGVMSATSTQGERYGICQVWKRQRNGAW